MHRATQAYIQTSVTTTDQGDILVMLYDGALKFMNLAKECLAANDMAGKGNHITRTLHILEELTETLDMEKGGALAENLRTLYDFCSNRLIMANIKKSPEMIDEVIKIVTGLRSAFAAIVDLPEAKEAAAQAAAKQRASGILPGRTSAGTATASTAPTAPGAEARFRGLYAKKQQEVESTAAVMPTLEEKAPQGHQNKETDLPLQESTLSTGGISSTASNEKKVQEDTDADKLENSRETLSSPTDFVGEKQMPPPVGSFGLSRVAGSAFYKKMSQQ